MTVHSSKTGNFMDCQMRLWQTCSLFQRKLRGRKRLVGEVDVDMVPGKSRVGVVIVFMTSIHHHLSMEERLFHSTKHLVAVLLKSHPQPVIIRVGWSSALLLPSY